MPVYLDRHDLNGLTAAEIAETHRRGLESQSAFGVRVLTTWFDHARGEAFSLIDAPDLETVMHVHHDAHGAVASNIIEVEPSAIDTWLCRVANRLPSVSTGEPAIGPSFYAVMFTDIVDSTGITTRLGDAAALTLVRAHDKMVRRALSDHGGWEVKHTGDGIMASFDHVAASAASACAIQRSFAAFNDGSSERLRVRIGIDAGEPLQDSNDLFGATVQIAARICQDAAAEAIVVSETVRGILPEGFKVSEIGPRQLKGFATPIALYEVLWR